MKKQIAFILLVIFMFPCSSLAGGIDLIPVEINTTDKELKLPIDLYFTPTVIDENGNEVSITSWESSNKEIVKVLDTKMYSRSQGSCTLTGKTAEKTYSFKITIPKVYTTHDEIVIDSPDPIIFGYQINATGVLRAQAKGSAAKLTDYPSMPTKSMGAVVAAVASDMTFFKITPQKAGTSKIVFTANGKTVGTVNITVKKSAIKK